MLNSPAMSRNDVSPSTNELMRRSQSEPKQRRPRVLVLAYSCGPGCGSEPGAGWHRAIEISQFADAWIVVHEEWKERIESHLEQRQLDRQMQFHFVRSTRFEKFLRRVPGAYFVAYNMWQRRAYRRVQQLQSIAQFDLVHQLTFCGFREPSYLYRLGVPFIWGPVGGTQRYPLSFVSGAGLTGGFRELTRSLVNSIQLRWAPRVRRAAASAARVIAANASNADVLRAQFGVSPIVLPDVGIQSVVEDASATRQSSGHLRILWAGVLGAHKALELLIEALALLPDDVAFELRVLGDGPCRTRWKRLAQRRKLTGRIRWFGNVGHEEAMEQFRWADVFVFTSLRDTTGTVLVEALAAGTPVITVDHQGAHDVVTESCGKKIPVSTRRNVQRDLSEAIAECARNLPWREACSKAARQRARQYLWKNQGQVLAGIYDDVLRETGSDARCDRRNCTSVAERQITS